MKTCKYCGTQNFSTSSVCSKCQQALDADVSSTAQQPQQTENVQQPQPSFLAYPYYGQSQRTENVQQPPHPAYPYYGQPQQPFPAPYPYYGQATPTKRNLQKATKIVLWIYTGIYAFALLISIALWIISLMLLNELNLYSYGYNDANTLVALTCLGYLIGCLISFTVSICFTLVYNKKIAQKKPISTAFKVCTLLFTNFIAGILMLCDND